MNHISQNRDIAASLAGQTGDRDRFVGYSTRRVVMASLGLLREQQAGRKRIRAVGIAAALGVILVVGPLAWWFNDAMESGEHLADISCQLCLWVICLCPALLAAAVVAGWLRNRS